MCKIKILYLVTRCIKSGPIQVLNNIVDNLDKNKFDLYLVSISDEDERRSILDNMKQKFKYCHISVSKKNAILGQYNELLQFIMKINPDIIHSTGVVPDYIISKTFPNKQLIIAHSNVMADYTMYYGKLFGWILARQHIRIMKKAKKVIACSKNLSDIYEKKEKLKMEYIRNGLNHISFKIADDKWLREKFNLPQNVKIFIYTASFNKRKNHKFLLQSFVKLNKESRQCALLLLGDGPTYEKCYKTFSHYPFIYFIGRVKNVEPYLMSSDYFISTSKQEGMPMAVLEAMNQGLPYILSDIPQHREIYEIDTSIGKLYKEDNFDSLKNCIKEILNYSKNEKGEKINSIVYNKFNAKKMGKSYENIYIKMSNQ